MTDACGNSSSSLYVSVCRTTCTRDLHNFLMPKALYCTVPPLLNQFRVSVHDKSEHCKNTIRPLKLFSA